MLPGKKYTSRDFIEILRRRAWLLILPPIVTTFAALVYARSIPDVYQSDMLIAIVPQRVPDSFVRTTVTLKTEERLNALAAQVTSRTILEQLINEFDLYKNERSRLPMEDVVAGMRKAIATPIERSGPRGNEPPPAFHVQFTYTDPRVAARVTQRLGSLFVEQNARDRGSLASATDQFLESQLGEARQRLEAQERRLEAFRRVHGNELPSQMQLNLQAMQSTQMQIQASVESVARDRDRKLMLERLYGEALNEPAPVRVLPGPVNQEPAAAVPPNATPYQQLEAARAALARLELRLRPEHPDVVRAKRTIAELEQAAAAAAAVPADPPTTAAVPPVVSPEEAQHRERLHQMAAEIESLDRQTGFKESQLERLRGLVAEYQRRIEAVPAIESEWAVLSRDYDTQQQAYKDLLVKSEAAKVAVDLEQRRIGEQFRILDPAGIPVRPVGSMRRQINAAGFALGLLLGVGMAAFLELKDASIRSEGDVLEVLALPVLALIPHIETVRERRIRRWRLALTVFTGLSAVTGGAYVFWSLELWNSLL